MTFTYNPATDRLEISGEGNVEDYLEAIDIFNEDLAGNVQLLAPTSPGAGLTLTYQVMPADSLALKIDFILAGSDAGAGDTIHVVGTNEDDEDINEDIDVSGGNGTYTTSDKFKTIDHFDCVGFAAGTVEVKQNRLGRVWKVGDRLFRFDCHIRLSGWTYFETKMQILHFMKELYLNQGYVRAGEEHDNRGKFGSYFHIEGIFQIVYGGVELFGTKVYAENGNWGAATSKARLFDCDIRIGSFTNKVNWSAADREIKNCRFYETYWTQWGQSGENIENMVVTHASGYNIYFVNTGSSGVHKKWKNIRIEFCGWHVRLANSYIDILDWENFDKTKIVWYASASEIHVFYSFNFKTIKKDKTPLSGVSVKAYKNGDYTDYTPNDGATPVIDAATDGNGDIPTQELKVMKLWGSGSLPQEEEDYYPFLFILEHADYPSKKFMVDITEKSSWVYAYGLETPSSHDDIIKEIKKNRGLIIAF